MIRGVLAGLVGAALLLAPIPVAAQSTQPSELAAARSLFNEARELEKQGQWAEALTTLEAVASVRMTAQVRFHIALCHEHIGKLVAARNGFETARREAREEKAEQVLLESTEHIEALEARIPSVRIKLSEQPPGLSVLIDGDEIQTGLLAVPIPLDPGEHRVRVTAPGHEDVERIVSLEEGATQDLAIEMQPLPAPVAAKPKPMTQAPIAPSPPPKQESTRDGNVTSGDPTLGWVLVGTGGALLVGSAVSAIVRSSAISDIDDSCPSHTGCDPSLKDTRDQAQTFGTLAAVLGGLGVATVGAGGYLVWSSSPGQADETNVAIRPTIHPEGLSMSGVVVW
jgi:PEGA domain